MLFNSFGFLLLFFPITLLGFYSIAMLQSLRLAQCWLILCSLIFHAYWKASYTWLFILSMVINYGFGLICRVSAKRLALIGLISGIIFNLVLLAYFKYAGFLGNLVLITSGYYINVGEITLPLAISFYTFQQIAFLVDTYREKDKIRYSLFQYISYLAFFPHLIAGPIVKHNILIKQLSARALLKFKSKNVLSGITIILIGLFKKTVLADGAAIYANPIFASVAEGAHPGMMESWLAAILFSFVIYFDFSGYSDMAIGLARTFNVRFPENFSSPYKSRSIIEFWQRWHITLSHFLRDYLYISLGGNRKGKARYLCNLLITMLLGGLWHGAGWNFIIWGGLHGVYLIIAHLWRNLVGQTQFVGRAAIGRVMTYAAICVAWVFFRSSSINEATIILKGMIGMNGFMTNLKLPPGYLGNGMLSGLFFALGLLLFVNLLPNTQQFMRLFRPVLGNVTKGLNGLPGKLVWQFNAISVFVLTMISCFAMTRMFNIQSFIYFRF